MKKGLKIALLSVGILVIVPLAFLVILSEVHYKPAHKKAIDYINQEFGGAVAFEDFSISYIRHFPHIHLRVENITAHDGQIEVIRVAQLDLLVNLSSLWREKVMIEHLVIEGGALYSEIDSLGRKPVILARKNKEEKSSDISFDVESQDIRIIDSKVYFGNQVKSNRTWLTVNEADLRLSFSDTLVILTGTLDAHLDTLVSNNTVLFANQPVKGEAIDFRINPSTGEKVLHDGYLLAHTLTLYPRFTMTTHDDGQIVELHISGDGNFNAFLDLFEFHFGIDLEQTNPDAELRMAYNQRGFVNPFLRPYTEIDFEIAGASFSGDDLPYPIENVAVAGNYNNGEGHSPETVQLEIDTLHAEIQQSFVNARLKLTNLKDPEIDAHFISGIDISHFIKQSDNIRIKGTVDADLVIDGRISELKLLHLEGKQAAKGTIRVKDLELLINDKALKVELSSGSTLLNNHILEVTSLVGAYNESAFHFEGLFENLDQYILSQDKILGGSFSLSFDRLDLRYLFPGGERKERVAPKSSMPSLDGLVLNLDVAGKEVITGLGSLENLRMKTRVDNGALQVRSASFNYQDGNVAATATLKLKDRGIASLQADIKGTFQNIDLELPEKKEDKPVNKSKSFSLPESTDIRLDLIIDRGNIATIPVRKLHLAAAMINDEIILEKFEGDVLDGHAGISGKVKLDSSGISEFRLQGGLAFNKIDIVAMMDDFGIGKKAEKSQSQLTYPETVLLDLDLKIKEIDYKDATLRNFSTLLHADDKRISISDLEADLPFGELRMNLEMDQYQHENISYLGNINLDIDSLSVDRLLELEALGIPGRKELSPQPENTDRKKGARALPDNFTVGLVIKAGYLAYRNAEVENLDLAINYGPEKTDLKKLKFDFLNGKVDVYGHVSRKDGNSYPGYLYSKVDDLDIRTLFYSFDNFNQDKFTAENSSGKISWSSHYYFELGKNMVPVRDGNLWIMNINVHEAEFDKVEPIEKTLFFVGHKSKDKMLISQLNINAMLFRDKLYVRDVLMNDNVANLDVFGEVDLGDRTMDLGLEISLSDLFFRTKKRRIVQTEEGEVDLENDSKLFLNLTGPLQDHKLKLMSRRKFQKARDGLNRDIRKAETAFKERQNRPQ
jgi:hypothetical protein